MREINRKRFLQYLASTALMIEGGNASCSAIDRNKQDIPTAVKRLDVSAAAIELYARMTVRPSRARRTKIESLISSLHAAGVWRRLDGFYMFAAHDIQAARLNWVGCMADVTSVNAPTFLIDRGFSGDGAAAYLDTNTAVSSLDIFQPNDATVGIHLLPTYKPDTGLPIGCNSLSLHVSPDEEGLTMYTNFSSSLRRVFKGSDYGSGLLAWSRSDRSAHLYHNGEEFHSFPVADGYPLRGPIEILKANGRYTAQSVSAAFFGAGLTASQHAAVNSALNLYLGSLSE